MGVNSGRKGIIEEESYAVSRHSSDGSSVVMTWFQLLKVPFRPRLLMSWRFQFRSRHTFYGNSLIGVYRG